MPRPRKNKMTHAGQGELFSEQTIRGIKRLLPNPQLLKRLKMQQITARSKSVITIGKLQELTGKVNSLKGTILNTHNQQELLKLKEELEITQKTLNEAKEVFTLPKNRQVLINRLRTPLKEALEDKRILGEQQKQILRWYLSASRKGTAWNYYPNARKIINAYREKVGKKLIA